MSDQYDDFWGEAEMGLESFLVILFSVYGAVRWRLSQVASPSGVVRALGKQSASTDSAVEYMLDPVACRRAAEGHETLLVHLRCGVKKRLSTPLGLPRKTGEDPLFLLIFHHSPR